MEYVKCICCGLDDYVVVLTRRKDESKKRIRDLIPLEEPTRFVACKSCGFVYQNPRLEMDRLNQMYEESYRVISPQRHRPPDVEVQAQWISQTIENKLAGREILDVGCDTGSLLNLFKRRGWNTFGVEPTVLYAEYGIRKNGHNIEIGLFGDKTFEGKKFDLITISHVIEHVPEPLGLLISARNKMKEGGYLYVGTPNVTKPKIGFWGVFSFEHLYLFSPASIANILHRAGLDIKAIRAVGAKKGIELIAQKARSKKFEFLIDKPDEVKKTIGSFRLKLPFLEAKRNARNFYKSIYKSYLRKHLKGMLFFFSVKK